MHSSNRLYEIILILSFLALWLSVQLNEQLEYLLGYFLVLSIGVGHGANDLKIYFKNQQLGLKTSLKFIIFYALAVVAGFAAFFILPDLILALFLIISGFHFGQEHFERYDLKKTLVKTVFMTSYGLMILLALFHLNIAYSLPIISDLVISSITPLQIEYALYLLAAITIISGIVTLKKIRWSSIAKELLYLIVIYIIFATSSLIWGFAIYFILWHSVPSIHHQIDHLYGAVDKKSILSYLKSSFLFWIAALIFLSVLYYFLNDKTTLFLSVIVAFLGGITFPHVFVMHRIHEK